jgi:DNA-binding transcriptional regulator GbsR (MarR family)
LDECYLGLLLISDPPAQSITELGEKLHASKSSISVMARLLVENGLIERVASPVPRRHYYRIKPARLIFPGRRKVPNLCQHRAIIAERSNLSRPLSARPG